MERWVSSERILIFIFEPLSCGNVTISACTSKRTIVREMVHIGPHGLRRPPIGRELSVVLRIRRAFTRCCKTLDDRRWARAGWLSPVPARQTASRCNYSVGFRILFLSARLFLTLSPASLLKRNDPFYLSRVIATKRHNYINLSWAQNWNFNWRDQV